MQTIALMGPHGTGKTTVYEALRKQRPDFSYFSTPEKYLLSGLKYKDSFDMIKKIGIGQFALMNISTWAAIDPIFNTTLEQKQTIIADGSMVETSAQYLVQRETSKDYELCDVLKRIAKYHAALITKFIYFPIGVLPIKTNETLPERSLLQKIDENIPRAFGWLGVPDSIVHRLKSVSIEDRVREVLHIIEG